MSSYHQKGWENSQKPSESEKSSKSSFLSSIEQNPSMRSKIEEVLEKELVKNPKPSQIFLNSKETKEIKFEQEAIKIEEALKYLLNIRKKRRTLDLKE